MPEQLSFPQAGVWPRPSDAWQRPEDWVFFALQPDRAVAMEIAELARHERAEHGLKGGRLGTDRFHVSLYGLGESAAMPQTTVAAAIDAAVSIALPPFDVAFDRVLSFRGARKRRPLVLCGGDGLGAETADPAEGGFGISRLRSRTNHVHYPALQPRQPYGIRRGGCLRPRCV
jgi:RNA 2',3'-cyclic 3'-phosphodiesterase